MMTSLSDVLSALQNGVAAINNLNKQVKNTFPSAPTTPTTSRSELVNVINFGADPTGVTDSASSIQTAINTLTTGVGILFFPAGTYSISAELVCANPISILGSGRRSSFIVASGDSTVFKIQGSGSVIRDLACYGATNIGTTNPCLSIDVNAGECHFEDCQFRFGKYSVFCDGFDNLFIDCKMGQAFGSAVVKSRGGGNYWIRNKMDQNWPTNMPAVGYVVNAWAATTAYIVGDVVTNNNWYMQCVSAGLSGGSAPALQTYEAAITDGGVTWNIAMPLVYFSFQMDTNARENFMWGNDHSGPWVNGIAMTNTGDEGAGSDPNQLWVDSAVIGQQRQSSVRLLAGSKFSIVNSEISAGWDPSFDASGVMTQIGWGSGLQVSKNLFAQANPAAGAVGLYGVQTNVVIADNMLFNTWFRIVEVISGGGNISDFNILGNITDTSASIVIGNDVDWYVIANNNTHGGGVNDTGVGVNKSITGNI